MAALSNTPWISLNHYICSSPLLRTRPYEVLDSPVLEKPFRDMRWQCSCVYKLRQSTQRNVGILYVHVCSRNIGRIRPLSWLLRCSKTARLQNARRHSCHALVGKRLELFKTNGAKLSKFERESSRQAGGFEAGCEFHSCEFQYFCIVSFKKDLELFSMQFHSEKRTGNAHVIHIKITYFEDSSFKSKANQVLTCTGNAAEHHCRHSFFLSCGRKKQSCFQCSKLRTAIIWRANHE